MFCPHAIRALAIRVGPADLWLGYPSQVGSTANCSSGHFVLHTKRIRVVRAGNVVAKVFGALPLDTPSQVGSTHWHPMANCSMLRPLDVLHTKRMCVVGAGYIVAEIFGALAFDTSHVAAARDDLLTPDGSVAALRQHVVLGAKEQNWATDTVVPRLWALGQRQTPDLADVLDVVRVVHVQLRQLVSALLNRDRWQVNADGLWACRPPREHPRSTGRPRMV